MNVSAMIILLRSAAVLFRPAAALLRNPRDQQFPRAAAGPLDTAALRKLAVFFVLALLILISRTAPLWAAEPAAPTTNTVPARVAFTNLVAGLPVHDRVWLMGEQLKQLVGDWVNQQGDVGLDLIYFLQEPTKLLADEVKRMESQHQKEIADLRAEIQALRQAVGNPRTNLAISPAPSVSAASTNRSESRPGPRAGGN